MTVVELWVEAVISDSFAANVCVVLVVTIFVPALPAVMIALVYDIVVLVFDEDAIWAATACARFSAACTCIFNSDINIIQKKRIVIPISIFTFFVHYISIFYGIF